MRRWLILCTFAVLGGCTLPSIPSANNDTATKKTEKAAKAGVVGKWKGDVVMQVKSYDGSGQSETKEERSPITVEFKEDKTATFELIPDGSKSSEEYMTGTWTVMGGNLSQPSKIEMVLKFSGKTGEVQDEKLEGKKAPELTLNSDIEWNGENDMVLTPTSAVDSQEGPLKELDEIGILQLSRVLN